MTRRPSFDFETPSDTSESRQFDKHTNDETVETLVSYLCCSINRRCPNCKKQIKACSRTERQIRSIVEKVAAQAIQSNSNASPLSSSHPHISSNVKPFATVRRSCHEKRFLSPELQSSFSNIFDRHQAADDKIETKIIFKNEKLLNGVDEKDHKPVIEKGSLSHSDKTMRHYGQGSYGFSFHPFKKKTVNAPGHLKFPFITQTDASPLCLSQNCNNEAWG